MAFALARRAGDVAPYHGRAVGAGAMCAYVVGADVSAARVHAGVSDGVCVGAARRGRRALPWARGGGRRHVCVCGRGRRPRRPAYTRAFFRWRLRWRGAPGTSRPTMGAMVRADMVCGHGVWAWHDGRGRRPRRPACLWRPRCRPRWRGAPGTSRPTMGARRTRAGGGVVGADIPAARVHVGVSDGVCVGAARRGRRALPWARGRGRRHVCVRGRGRRPGGPRTRGRFRWRLRWRGAPGTSRPTMGAR